VFTINNFRVHDPSEYAFSEDLDFSAVDAPRGQALEEAVREAVNMATNLLSAHGPFQIETTRYIERDPHPGGQEAFIARVKFPWYPSPLCRIKVEITHNEPVLLEAERRALIHGYEEELAASLHGYPLAEIVVEKMRALLQTQQKLLARGWNRPRAHWHPCLRRIPGRRFLATTAWLAGWRRRLRSTRSRLPATKLTERAT